MDNRREKTLNGYVEAWDDYKDYIDGLIERTEIADECEAMSFISMLSMIKCAEVLYREEQWHNKMRPILERCVESLGRRADEDEEWRGE